MNLHLMSGSNLIPGWINADLNPPPGGESVDLSKPFPWPAGSVDYVFCEHGVEHLSWDQAVEFLNRIRVVLKTGGVVRISTPDLVTLVGDYMDDRIDRWHVVGWKPKTAAHMINEGLRLWQHLFVHDFDSLSLAFREAGFKKLWQRKPGKSPLRILSGLECRPDCDDLIIEATK